MEARGSPQKPHKNSKIAAIIAIVVILVVLIAIFVLPSLLDHSNTVTSTSPPPSPPPSPSPQSIILLSSGTVESLNAGYWIYVNFSVPANAYSIFLNGSYTSNNHVEVGVLTSYQYGAFTQNPSTISNAGYYSGNNDGATIYFIPSSGTSYTLVIYDGNFITADTVTIVNAITLTYTT